MAVFSYNRILQRQWYGSYFLKLVESTQVFVSFFLEEIFPILLSLPLTRRQKVRHLEIWSLSGFTNRGTRRGHVSGFPMVSSETLTLVLPRMPSFPFQYPPVTTSLSFKAVLPNPSFIHLMRKLKLRAAEACAWETQAWLSGTHALFTGSVHAVSSVVSDSLWFYRL